MPTEQDPKWEIVDELPDKKPKPKEPHPILKLLKSKRLWLALGLGFAAVFAFPVLRILLQNLVKAWWLWLGLAIYWFWRRLQKANPGK